VNYRGFYIECWPKPIPVRNQDYEAYRDDEEPTLTGASVVDIKAQIDEVILEELENYRGLR